MTLPRLSRSEWSVWARKTAKDIARYLQCSACQCDIHYHKRSHDLKRAAVYPSVWICTVQVKHACRAKWQKFCLGWSILKNLTKPVQSHIGHKIGNIYWSEIWENGSTVLYKFVSCLCDKNVQPFGDREFVQQAKEVMLYLSQKSAGLLWRPSLLASQKRCAAHQLLPISIHILMPNVL